jgi:hypothetical protein
VLFIKTLLVGMLAMLDDDESLDIVTVALMVPLIEAVVIAFSYAEQFALGAVGQFVLKPSANLR